MRRDRQGPRATWRRRQLRERGACPSECLVFFDGGQWMILLCRRSWNHYGMHVGRLWVASDAWPHLVQLARAMMPDPNLYPTSLEARAWVRWR